MPETEAGPQRRKKSVWAQKAFAWFLHAGNRLMRDVPPGRKERLFDMLSGRVLEIGPGAGANIPLYPENTTIIGVEPNRFMFRYLREEARESRRTLHIVNGRAEALGLRNDSVDAIVCTHVLCSVDDLETALRELLRVLKPGGLFVFLEHVAAPRATGLRFFQRILRPGWQKGGDGCRLDREVWRSLEQAGFEGLTYDHFRVPWAILVSPHIVGSAIKAPISPPTESRSMGVSRVK